MAVFLIWQVLWRAGDESTEPREHLVNTAALAEYEEQLLRAGATDSYLYSTCTSDLSARGHATRDLWRSSSSEVFNRAGSVIRSSRGARRLQTLLAWCRLYARWCIACGQQSTRALQARRDWPLLHQLARPVSEAQATVPPSACGGGCRSACAGDRHCLHVHRRDRAIELPAGVILGIGAATDGLLHVQSKSECFLPVCSFVP
jgi:hypothetical protein